MKRLLKLVAIVLTLLVSIYFGLLLMFGRIDYSETFSTRYIRTDTAQIIITKHFEIGTPKNWIHIFHGYGEEGEAVGSFLTKYGKVRYEYGLFSNPFDIDSIFVFSRDSLTVNRFELFIGRNNDNMSGIYIPRQNEMEWSFSIFLSTACTKNINAITRGIKQLKFK